MHRPSAILIASVLSVAILAGGIDAQAAPRRTSDDRDRVRAERATVASQIDTLKASRQDVEAALGVIEANVAAVEAKLADAQRAVDAARAEQAAAQLGIEATTARVRQLRRAMADRAVAAYVAPTGSALSAVLESGSASEAAQRRALLELGTERDADLTDRIRAATAELEARRRAAAAAGARAEEKRAAVDERLAEVNEARKQQRRVVDGVQQRINSEVSRSIDLAKQDKALSARIALEQAALQARLYAARQAQRAQADRVAAQSQQSQQSRPAYGDGGSESGPLAPPGPARPSGSSGGVSLCSVGGITVNCQISGSLGSMLRAAAAAGVRLSGSGWRDPAQQIALRQQHCGSSSYAIYQMSPSACRPPTARPGQSMHEVGLAVDFGACGRGSACYRWLKGNASRFGFFNLPSESWHWSVNGQ